MFNLDYSKKVLHIVINTTPTTKNRTLMHEGIIMLPDQVFSKINTSAEHYFAEFFKPGHQFKTACLETEMGPGELVTLLREKFNSETSSWIGGIIARFTIKPAYLDKLWTELTTKQKRFYKSKEKKTFGKAPIRGLAVKK